MNIKYNINLSLAANIDLEEIFSYIVNTSSSEQTAKDIMLKIHEMILSLSEMPQRFSLSLDPTLAGKGYRRANVKKYIILYLTDEENKTVTIARIFHSSMDYEKYI